MDEAPEILHGNEIKNRIKRGDEINILQKDPTIRDIMLGVGWDLKAFESDPLDLDVSLFLLNLDEKTRVDEDFIFYNNLQGSDNAVQHLGDSRTGAGDGDDEAINISLQALPFDISKISIVLSIYPSEKQNHDFSMVKNVYFRLVNQVTNHELFRYELDKELSGGEGLIIAELERVGSDWIFHATGEVIEGGLPSIAENYGIIVAENVRA